VRLAAGPLRLELEPATGGAVTRFDLVVGGRATPLFRAGPDSITDVLQAGCFPLVPFCNRVRDGRFSFGGREVVLAPNLSPQRHPLHGQGWRAPWRVTSQAETTADLAYLHASGEWPWAYEASQRFRLSSDRLELELSCRNTSAETMPCGLGLHPFFTAAADTLLDTDVEHVWTVDEEVMPVERVPATGRYALRQRRISGAGLDNGYEGWSGEARIDWPAAGLALTIRSSDCTRFQVYAPPEGGLFCAEPVTNANDVFSRPVEQWEASGLRLLAPGETLSMTATFEVSGTSA